VNTPYDELTYAVIGCAMAVHRKLGPALRENSYQRDLEISLAEKNIPFEAQKLYEVYDKLSYDQLTLLIKSRTITKVYPDINVWPPNAYINFDD
jgi:GxxExxY protein